MGGICGIFGRKGQSPDEAVLARMVATLKHRGPDDNGYMIDGVCGLGNTRLAILDPGPAGHQPFHVVHNLSGISSDAWITYDGLVGNFQEIRSVLLATRHQFLSGTDTETLLRAYMQFGQDNFAKPFRGAFALAIWDSAEARLILMRDRLGEKPLYYVVTEDWLIFGSEIKAILVHPDAPKRLNEEMVPHYLGLGHTPSPYTLFEGILSLQPGHMLAIGTAHTRAEVKSYWRLPLPVGGLDDRTEDDIAADLLAHLRWAIRTRLVANPPVGVLLSEDIGSLALIAILTQESPQTVHTFTVELGGAHRRGHRAGARQLAARYVTKHHELIVEPDPFEIIVELIRFYDQPFADPEAIPSYYMSRLARETVATAMASAGSDYLFAGPAILPAGFGSGSSTDGRTSSSIAEQTGGPLPMQYLAHMRKVPEAWMTALMGEPAERAIQNYVRGQFVSDEDLDAVSAVSHAAMGHQLADGLLQQIDRTSMAASLIVAVPFVDHHLVHFAAGIPADLKLHKGLPQYILGRCLQGIVPERLLQKRKVEAVTPIGEWLRNEFSAVLEEVLLSKKAAGRGIWAIEPVRSMIAAHMSGETDLGQGLWTLLTFEIWMQEYLD